jgi:hypothetical protein
VVVKCSEGLDEFSTSRILELPSVGEKKFMLYVKRSKPKNEPAQQVQKKRSHNGQALHGKASSWPIAGKASSWPITGKASNGL